MEREVRFSEKKVDQSWKEEVDRDKVGSKGSVSSPSSKKPGLSFATFLTSLAYQTLMHLGEAPHSETQKSQLDLEAAKETIDLLVLLEAKTQGNRTSEEDQLLKGILSQLQMKFVEKVSGS